MTDSFLKGDYPNSWGEYVGQENAKRTLLIGARSAKIRGANLAHTLIASPYAGIGKTALAQLAVREMDRRVHVVSGAMNMAKVRMMFSMVEDGDVIFYDEIHKAMDMGKRHAEWMLHYLENGVIVTNRGEEKMPQVTIIGATTDMGVLPEPILQRFHIIELEQYTDDEATMIAANLATKTFDGLLPPIGKDCAVAVARAGSNQPRMMRQILHSIRDLAIVGAIDTPQDGDYDLAEALTFAGVTEDGLTNQGVKYLRILYTELAGEPAGGALMRERMGLVGNGLNKVEQLLLDKDLIEKTKQGRLLTRAGMRRSSDLFGGL